MRSIKELLVIVRDEINDNEEESVFNAILSLSLIDYIDTNEIKTIVDYIRNDCLKQKPHLYMLYLCSKQKFVKYLENVIHNKNKEEVVGWLNKHINKL